MAITIATVNTSQLVGIPDVRNAIFRQTNLPSNWQRVKMGILWTMVPASNTDTYCAAETITPASYLDWFTFGLKDGNNYAPGYVGSGFTNFCGLIMSGTTAATNLVLTSNQSAVASIDATNHHYLSTMGNGALITNYDFGNAVGFPKWVAGAGSQSFMGLDITLTNVGASNQTAIIGIQTSNTGQTDCTIYGFRNLIFNTALTYTSTTLNFYTGGAAVALPTYFWLRVPFNNNRIRIANMAVFQVA